MRAQAMGALVPRGGWSGKVVSVYSKAINLLHPEGLLVGLVAYNQQMSAFSLLVPQLFLGEPGAGPRDLELGKPCRCSEDRLSVGSVSIELAEALTWSGSLGPPPNGAFGDMPATVRRLEAGLASEGADDGLRELIVGGSSPTIFGRKARELLTGVETRSVDRQGSIGGLSTLVGLGIGFTPSGDDFISGALLGEEMTSQRGGIVDREEIGSALPRTNHGGRTLLVSVIEGQFPDYLLRFAAALYESERIGPVDDEAAAAILREAVRAAASHGETSGTDAVSGVAWYLRRALGGHSV